MNIKIPILILSSLFSTQSQANNVQQYQELVSKWLGLTEQTQVLQADWLDEKHLLQQRVEMLKLEQSQLTKKLSASKEVQGDVAQKRQALLQQQTQLEQQQANLQHWLEKKSAQIHEIKAKLPPPLHTFWQTELDSLTNNSSNSEKLDVFLRVLSKKAEFDNTVSFQKSMLALGEGDERVAEQLYFGSQLGYAISKDGSLRLIGHPQGTQWQWQQTELFDSAQFELAKNMFEHKTAAELIELPVLLDK